MQMGSGGSTRGANIANDLAFGHRYAALNAGCKTIEMGIAAHVSTVVHDINGFAVAAVPARIGYDATAYGSNRRTSLGGKIDARMRQGGLANRVEAGFREQGSNIGKFQWKAQERAGKATAFGIIIVALAFLLFKIDGGEFVPCAQEFRGHDSWRALPFVAFAATLLVKDFIAISGADFLFEVNIPGKDIGKLRE